MASPLLMVLDEAQRWRCPSGSIRRINSLSRWSATVKSEKSERGCANGRTTLADESSVAARAAVPTPTIFAFDSLEIATSTASVTESPVFGFRTLSLSGDT